MRDCFLSMAMIALLAAELAAAGPPEARTIPAPVRLPAVAQATSVMLPTHWPTTPKLIPPIAARDFESFEPAPAVELDLDLPQARRTTVGGWIDVGYRGGAAQ